jgi:peroxisomal membrane protein 2
LQHRHTSQQQHYSLSDPLADVSNDSNDETPPSLSRHVSNHWDSYVSIVERRPLVTKSITATIILGGADLCAQGLEHARGISDTTGIDWPRAARFAAFGLFGAPWSHYYFYWLDHWLPPSKKPCSWTTFLKVIIDQFIQAPLLLAVMICALSIMKGQGLKGMKQDMHDNFVNALLANCM